MYQFTTTNVINSAYALDYNGTILVDGDGTQIPKFSGSSTAFKVAKVGSFLPSKITGLYKRPYTAGVLEVGSLTVPASTSGHILKFTVDIKLSGSVFAEYANYSLDYKKPVVVEVVSTGVTTTNATAIVAQLNALKNRFGHSYFTASASGANITITAKEYTQRFKSISLDDVVADSNSISQYSLTNLATGTITTAGKEGFGDDAWMIKTVYVPTAENVRYFGISRDERPVLGGNYTEYALHYSIDKDGESNIGIMAGAKSVTTHIFYVKSDLVAGFEAALLAASVAIDTIGTAVSAVTIGGNTLTLSAGAGTTTLTATTTPSGVTGGIWALTGDNIIDGTLDATKLTLTTAGVMTIAAGSGLIATDTIGVSVTIDGYTKTGDVTIAGS